MRKYIAAFGGLAVAATLAGTAFSESHVDKDIAAAVKARQAQMTLYSFNLGVLGTMAKGDMDYDAEAASAAAANLTALSRMDQSRFWPQGSDNGSLGDMTAALPAIWAADSDIGAKSTALTEAAGAMESAAGQGLEAIQGAMGALGGACSACHKAYRQSNN